MTSNDSARPSHAMADDMEALIKSYGHIIEHVRKTVNNALLPINEDELWRMIAPLHSPDWAQAHVELQAAENKIRFHRSYEHRPLGAIGHALESDVVNTVNEDWAVAQAKFTLIDEQLRENSALIRVLKKLSEEYHMLAESLGLNRQAEKLTQDFADAFAETNRGPSPLRKAFGGIARKIFRKPSMKPAAQKTPT